MKVIWGVACLFAAVGWALCAAGLLSYEPWMVTLAFAFVAVDLLLTALRVWTED